MTRHTMLSFALFVSVCAGCTGPDASARARTLVRGHHEREAAAVLRERLRAQPNDIAARRLLVRVLGAAGDVPAARAEAVELARRVNRNDPTPYIELGHALELAHRYDEALEAYDEAAVSAPASPEGPREGGLRCARWGEAEPARARLDEAVRRGAHDAETWHALGLVRLHLGDLGGAEDAYRAGAASDPKHAESWLGLATVAIVLGDAQKALDAYDEVLTLRPRFASAELGRAWALRQLGRIAEASRAIDRAEQLGAEAPFVARQRGALTASPDFKER